jgi:hypothetical protein
MARCLAFPTCGFAEALSSPVSFTDGILLPRCVAKKLAADLRPPVGARELVKWLFESGLIRVAP